MMALLEFFDKLPSVVREVGIAGLLDMAIVTLVIYIFMVVVKRTRRSGLIFTGILITGAVYLLARKFDLKLTAALLQGFFAVILVALVVIFQEDLRYFFERVALWWVERRLPLSKRKTVRLPSRQVVILARTLGDLARARIGALVVVRGKDFGFLKANDVKLAFELLDARPGWRTLPITVRALNFPEGLELEDIEPRQVRIQINQKPATNEVAAPKP